MNSFQIQDVFSQNEDIINLNNAIIKSNQDIISHNERLKISNERIKNEIMEYRKKKFSAEGGLSYRKQTLPVEIRLPQNGLIGRWNDLK